MRRKLLLVGLLAPATLIAGAVFAADAPPPGTARPATAAELVLGGYAETFYQWNFNDPSNGITNFRGFDNRHNSFGLTNVVLDAAGTAGAATVRVALQFGHTPDTYYLAEPVSPGAGGAATTGPSTWKFIQQANAGYRTGLGRGLLVEAGIFLSPIGPEGIAVKDQWNWSRSNLFFGLPFYHTGARISHPLGDHASAMVMVTNGWNSVVDNNKDKSVAAEVSFALGDALTGHVLYFGGVERPQGAAEGSPWRHLFDAYATWTPVADLSLNLHGDAGFEDNTFGTSSWAAGAASARWRFRPWLFLAGRADLFHEDVASNAQGTAAAIFWPSPWVASETLTADLRPGDNASVRLEFRHDESGRDMFFDDAVATDPDGAFVMNARSQNTLTAGMVVWF